MDNQNTQPEMKLMTCPLCFKQCNLFTTWPVNSIKGRMTKRIHTKCMERLGIKKLDFKSKVKSSTNHTNIYKNSTTMARNMMLIKLGMNA